MNKNKVFGILLILGGIFVYFWGAVTYEAKPVIITVIMALMIGFGFSLLLRKDENKDK